MKRIGLLSDFSYEARELKRALKDISELILYEVETLEEFDISDTVSGSIWALINLCDVLVAFVNNRTESLYYQIGLAHGAGKPVVIITHDEQSLPPEIRGQRILTTSHMDLYSSHFMFQLKEAIEDSLRKKSGYLGPRSEEKKSYRVSNDTQNVGNFRDLFGTEGVRRGVLFSRWFAAMASGIEGWEVIESEGNSLDDGFDLVIWNSRDDSELAILGNPIAIELKTTSTTNSQMLYQLLHMSKKSGIKGLILATTGSNNKVSESLFGDFRNLEQINAISLDRNDLINVKEPIDLLILVKSKVRELLYGRGF